MSTYQTRYEAKRIDTLACFPFDSLPERSSKKYIISILHIPKCNFYKFLKMAQWISDFESDYPATEEEVITRVHLSKYQAWVIFCLNQFKLEYGFSIAKLATLLKSKGSEIETQLTKKKYFAQYTGE